MKKKTPTKIMQTQRNLKITLQLKLWEVLMTLLFTLWKEVGAHLWLKVETLKKPMAKW